MKTKAGLSLVTLSLIALVLMCGLGASAQDQVTQQPATSAVPNLIRYGGVLKDANGAVLASQTLGVTFSLYRQQDGGVALWTETRNVTTNAAGQYSVMLGSTKPEGVSADLFSEQEQRWLGVQVQGQPEQSRVLMVSVPYAFQAHEAETLGGLPASAFVQAAPNATSSGSAAAGLTVNGLSAGANGTANAIKPPSGSVSNGPCPNSAPSMLYIPIFANPTGSIICNSVIYQTPLNAFGYVGISTTFPGAKLDVNGGATSGINTSNNPFAYMIGLNTVLSIVGPGNLQVGVLAGQGGGNNTFVGTNAGGQNTGSFNTFLGSAAGYGIGSGNNNICIGYNSCYYYNYNGSNNTIVGRGSGFYNTANNVTFLGDNAGYYNAADNNTFLGYNSGSATNNSGGFNTFVGSETGLNNTTGSANTYTGRYAGYSNQTGTNNVLIGDSAGFSNTGGFNTFVGSSAGNQHATGNGNTFLGNSAGVFAKMGANNTYLGNGAGAGASSANPNDGYNNTFSGFGAGGGNTLGHDNTFLGYLAGLNNAGGSSNVYLANQGINTDYNTIRIGNWLKPYTLQNQVFIEPILANQTTLQTVVTIDPPTSSTPGRLGYTTITSGGGNVVGPTNPYCNTNFLTMWLGTLNVGCSVVYQQPSTNFIGIGTIQPSTALDVNGDINAVLDRSSYQIGENPVLSIFPNNSANLFVGVGAGPTTTGTHNTFAGYNSGLSNTNGVYNAFFGDRTGESYSQMCTYPTECGFNTIVGSMAGYTFTSGTDNTFVGYLTASNLNGGGNYNVLLGDTAGNNLQSGDSNIEIGFQAGPPTYGPESATIRIGQQYLQYNTYIAGIYSSPKGTLPYQVVCVDVNGKLWGAAFGTDCTSSSRRYKEQIADMGDSSSKLLNLRPVTFFYKPQYDDGSHALQFGLIAEEVAKVYPEMAAYDKDGQPYAVRYQLLAPMLLNEFQKQHAVVTAQQGEMTALREQTKAQQQQMLAQQQEIEGLKSQLQLQNAAFQERLSRLESLVTTQMQTVADKPAQATTPATGGLQ